ncbi:hypothetical protein [Planomonospora alba]
MLVISLLIGEEHGIRPPSDLMVAREVTVTPGMRQRPGPDIVIVKKAALTSLQT